MPGLSRIAVVFLALSFGTAAAAPSPQAVKLDLAMQVMAASHARDNAMMIIDTMMPQMIQMIKGNTHDIPDKVLKRFQVLARADLLAALPELMKSEAEIYARHFSEEDLRALLAFYKSKAGQHMIAEMPKIMKETMPLGMMWGEQAGRDAMTKALAELRKEGVKI